ncbi:fungal-specific transcription factor domain-containing protein [Xylogone sp. PMI_703]|nr:fungal-specific transcription factor domain-containing protein [Xylogone sp. PMI_703]
MTTNQQEQSKRQSCWTCKDRKVRCDKYFPVCINCTRGKRQCVRSVVRLSWPEINNRRRFITSSHSYPGFNIPETQQNRTLTFINTSYWDVTLSMELDESRISPAHFNYWAYEIPRHLSQIPQPGLENQALLSYFDGNISTLLAPFGDSSTISRALFRMALADETPASSSVLHAILALSSLKLYGIQSGSPFKNKAISMLSSSLERQMDIGMYLRVLATSLLLSTYEISNTTELLVDWTFFLCGAIKVAKAMALPRVLDNEETILLDWLFGHTLLAQFSQFHWVQHESCVYRHPCNEDPELRVVYSKVPHRSHIVSFLGCSLEFLDILSSIRSAVLPKENPHFLSEKHRRELASIELQLRSIRQDSETSTSDSPKVQSRIEQVAELYRLAGLVYLHRAAQRTRVGFPPTEGFVQKAFSIIEVLGYCEALWPLFIIGCEARSDEQRMKILEVFSATQQMRDTGNIRSTKKMIEAAWIQHDLCEEGEDADYPSKINALMSAHQILPTFI